MGVGNLPLAPAPHHLHTALSLASRRPSLLFLVVWPALLRLALELILWQLLAQETFPGSLTCWTTQQKLPSRASMGRELKTPGPKHAQEVTGWQDTSLPWKS